MAQPALTVEVHQIEEAAQTRRLRTLGKLIPWPLQPEPQTDDSGCRTGILAKAEIRTKRFIDHRRVEEERYNAEIMAPDTSLHSVMQALTQAFAGMEEFIAQRPDGEPIVMEIRLRA
jgi:hypothetical protein